MQCLETLKHLMGYPGSSGFGSKTTADQVMESFCSHEHDLSSLTAVITGATSGIGAETARVLAKRGVRLILPARSLKAGEDTKARILSESPRSQIMVMPLDLSSLHSVTTFASQFLSLGLPLHLLINNAGKFAHHHEISQDGFEMTFATNYLGHFLLTKLLLERMVETAEKTGVQGRIVNVSSNIHAWFSGDILQSLALITFSKTHYDGTRAYALSKLANILHTHQLALTLQQMKANVTVNSVHPGIIKTRLTRDREGWLTDIAFFLASKLLKTIPQGAATTCYVATHPRLLNVSGKYFADCNEASISKLGSSSTQAATLCSASQSMISMGPKSLLHLLQHTQL